MEKKFNFWDFFRIPAEFRAEIYKKNKLVLHVLFWISIVFGGVFFPVFIFRKIDARNLLLIYYGSFLALGLLGHLLLVLKVPVPVVQVLLLAFILYIFTFILSWAPIITTIITFLTFTFLYVMIMESNPVIFVSCITIHLTVIFILIFNGKFQIPVERSATFFGNIALVSFANYYLAFWKRRHVINQLIRDRILAEEKEKTELLLQNVFPQKVINQLKEDGKAPPEKYENITVLFADIVDFTKTSSSMEPRIVIGELNEIFTEFDKITEKNGCMRIKTIGDAYLAVCGLPDKNEKHAEQLILCAREYISYLEERNNKSAIKWNIRIGIDSGNAIAGIIGLKKYVYDILGTTVDAAVKIEQSCKPMHIAVSDKTYELIKDVMTSKDKEDVDLIELKNDGE